MLAPPPPFLWQKNIWAGATLSPGATPRAQCTTENQVLQSPQPPEDSQQGVRARGVVPARGFEFQLPHFSCVTLCVGGWGGGWSEQPAVPPTEGRRGPSSHERAHGGCFGWDVESSQAWGVDSR